VEETFALDDVEREYARVAAAEVQFKLRNPQWRTRIGDQFAQHLVAFPELSEVNGLCEAAFVLASARMAVRHGSWGEDFHAYHNELHTREIVDQRICLLQKQAGWGALNGVQWLLLWLFAACHDLRQREDPKLGNQLAGANELSSCAETWRILDVVGFSRKQHQTFYQTLRLMIAASTFSPTGSKPREIASAMGASEDQMELVLLASDIDTANVAEPITALVRSAIRLVKENEYRAGRSDLGRNSAGHVLEFLTQSQKDYFARQQRFESMLGKKVFGPRKQRNHRAVEALTEGLRQHFSSGLGGVTGRAIIDELLERTKRLDS